MRGLRPHVVRAASSLPVSLRPCMRPPALAGHINACASRTRAVQPAPGSTLFLAFSLTLCSALPLLIPDVPAAQPERAVRRH